MANLQDILNSLSRAQEQTRKANEDRYAKILDIGRQNQATAQSQLNETGQRLYDRIGGVASLYENSGNQARRESGKQYESDLADSEQSLINRGMAGNPILAQAMRRRATEDFTNRNADISERVNNQKASGYLQTTGDLANFMLNRTGIETGLASQVAGAMERRTDQYPDSGAYSDLIRQIAQAQSSTPGRSYNFVGAGGSSRSPSSGRGERPSTNSSNYSSGGGGGGSGYDGSSGVQTFTNSGFSGAPRGFGDPLNRISGTETFTSGPSMILPGSSIFLGGRALGADGSVQGVGGTAGGPRLQNPGYLQVRNAGDSIGSGYYNETMPPGWEDMVGSTDTADAGPTETPISAENVLGKANAGTAASGNSGNGSSSGKERRTTMIGDPSPGHGWRVVGKTGSGLNTVVQWERG